VAVRIPSKVLRQTIERAIDDPGRLVALKVRARLDRGGSERVRDLASLYPPRHSPKPLSASRVAYDALRDSIEPSCDLGVAPKFRQAAPDHEEDIMHQVLRIERGTSEARRPPKNVGSMRTIDRCQVEGSHPCR
jgi:hypothetical protein